jgi:hypothetical protein
MSKTHLFNCTGCHQPFPVTEKNAGMKLACPFCEKNNVLPGMRQIQQLPVDDEGKSVVSVRKNDTKSLLFSGGLLVAVLASILGFTLSRYASSLSTQSTVDQQIEFGQEQIDRLPPGPLWDAWEAMTADGLPDWQETREVKYNKQAAYLSYIAAGLYAMAALGLLALVASFQMKHH